MKKIFAGISILLFTLIYSHAEASVYKTIYICKGFGGLKFNFHTKVFDAYQTDEIEIRLVHYNDRYDIWYKDKNNNLKTSLGNNNDNVAVVKENNYTIVQTSNPINRTSNQFFFVENDDVVNITKQTQSYEENNLYSSIVSGSCKKNSFELSSNEDK